MKIFHIGDLHFGKKLYDVNLAHEDQPYWVDKFLEAVKEEKPDAVVIAGDVYDRGGQPSEEAVALLSRFLKELAELGVCVLIVPGNHDSAIRLSFGKDIFQSRNLHIASPVSKNIECVSLNADGIKYRFWLLPYVYPTLLQGLIPEAAEGSDTYEGAIRAYLQQQAVDRSQCNILVAHQNVIAQGHDVEHSESESFVGNIGAVSYTVFDEFDYVALGHIHNLQSVGRETVRYAGCPLFYDFSEVNRKKAVTVVEFNGKQEPAISMKEIPMLHKLQELKGNIDDIIDSARNAAEDREKFYFQVKYSNDYIRSGQADELRNLLGNNLLRIARDIGTMAAGNDASTSAEQTAAAQMSESFENNFYAFMDRDGSSASDMMEDGKKLMQMICAQQEQHAGASGLDISEDETNDIIERLLKLNGTED